MSEGQHHTRRDAETLIALGLFMVVMALPVMLGTFWAGHGFTQAVNFLSGFVLFGVGAGMCYKGRRDLRKLG